MSVVGKLLKQILRFIFTWIDAIISKVITEVYNLLLNLSELVLYSDNIVKVIGRRIGLVLGIFMLFRLAISLVDYLISPDKVKDNAKGGGKLVTNVIISLVLLVTVNIIFEQAYRIQVTLVKSQIIEKIFFGKSSNTDMDIGYYLYSGFFTPNKNVLGSTCDDLWDTTFELEGSECEEKLYSLLGTNRNSIIKAKDSQQMSYVFVNSDLVLATDKGTVDNEFVFDYTPILSTAAGVIVLLVLISFSMDLATRAIKLLFLQIVAPVPIIYGIDPGKGKDVFQKWYKECINTYISVFLRLIAINFAVFMIVLVKGNFKDIFANNWLLNVFIIIGCLMFAKQVPKLLEDMLGIKMDGMSLKPLKKFQEQALFGKQITSGVTGLAAGTIGMGAGAIGAGIASSRLGGGIFKTTGSALRGALRGAGGGLVQGFKGKNPIEGLGKGFGQMKTNAEYVQSLDGTTFGGRLKAGIEQRIGLKTNADSTKAELEDRKNISGQMNSILERGKSESVKYGNLGFSYEFIDHTGTKHSGITGTVTDTRTKQAELDVLKNESFRQKSVGETNIAYNNAKNAWQQAQAERISDLTQEIMAMEKAAQLEYVSNVKATAQKIKNGTSLNSNDIVDNEMIQRLSDLEVSVDRSDSEWVKQHVKGVVSNPAMTGKDLKSTREALDVDTLRLEQSTEYKVDTANANATKPKGH